MDRKILSLVLLGLACLAYGGDEHCKMPVLDYDPPKLDTSPLEVRTRAFDVLDNGRHELD